MNVNDIITEATAPYENPFAPEEDFGLMTLKDFLWYRNVAGKSHPDDVYNTSLETMNRPTRLSAYDISDMSVFKGHKAIVNVYEHGMIVFKDDAPVAVFKDSVFYYALGFPVNILPINYETRFGDRLVITPASVKKVKYIGTYVSDVYNISDRNLKNYPAVMQNLKIGDETFTIRTTKMPYVKNSGESIVVFNEDNQIVAAASDEWRATLLRVVIEYRRKNLGQILGTVWYKNNPSFGSGGFSPSGKANAVKIWAGRVRELLHTGMYSQLVKNGDITKERVRKILADLPDRKSVLPSKPAVKQSPELLLYTDMESMFVLYDAKFYQEQDEKYIYAHGFLRTTSNKWYIFALDYDDQYRKLATYIIFQIAYNIKEKLYVETPPSDHLEISDIPEIVVDKDNYAMLTNPVMNLKPLADREKLYRKQHDKYDEAYYALLELANSKWK